MVLVYWTFPQAYFSFEGLAVMKEPSPPNGVAIDLVNGNFGVALLTPALTVDEQKYRRLVNLRGPQPKT